MHGCFSAACVVGNVVRRGCLIQLPLSPPAKVLSSSISICLELTGTYLSDDLILEGIE